MREEAELGANVVKGVLDLVAHYGGEMLALLGRCVDNKRYGLFV